MLFLKCKEIPHRSRFTHRINSIHQFKLKNIFIPAFIFLVALFSLNNLNRPLVLGDFFYEHNEFDQAIYWYKRARTNSQTIQIKLGKVIKKQQAQKLFREGKTLFSQFNFNATKIKWQYSLALLKEIEANSEQALVLHNLGVVYFQQDSFSLAEQLLCQAYQLNQSQRNKQRQGKNLALLSLIQAAGENWDLARKYQLQALEINRHFQDKKSEFGNLLNLGAIDWAQGNFYRARFYLEAALQIARQLTLDLEQAQALDNLALTYLALNDTTRFLDYSYQADSIFSAFNPLPFPEAAVCFNNRGNMLLSQKNLKSARQLFSRSIQLFQQSNQPMKAAESICNLGNLFQEQGDWETAFNMYQNALRFAQLKTGYSLQWHCLFNLAGLAEKFEQKSQAELYYQQAITLLEQRQLPSEKTVSPEYRSVCQRLIDLYYNSQKIEAAFALVERFKQLHFQLTKSDILGNSPDLANSSLISISSLQSALKPQQALIEFFSTSEATYLFCITGETTLFVKVAGISLIMQQQWLEYFRSRSVEFPQTVSTADTSWRRIMTSFYQLTLGSLEIIPHLIDKTDLIVVPDGFLFYLPFAAMLDANDKFLIETKKLTYCLSAAALVKVNPKKKNSSESIHIYAFPTTRAPETRNEVRSIAEIHRNFLDVIYQEQVNESYFRQFAPNAQLIHLAVHGELNLQNPRLSFLQLGGDEQADGYLQIPEIAKLPLQAHLVTLSACESGLGNSISQFTAPTNELISLSSAFLIAGAQNVVASLWKVHDYATAELMVSFHKYLAAGNDIATALAFTQRHFVDHPQYGHPYYWAGFVHFMN